MRLLILIMSLALVIPVITNQDEDDGQIPSISVNVKENQRLKLSDIALEVKKIEPEFGEESALGRIRRLRVYNDSVFVLDQFDNLLVFDSKGKYVRQIGRPWKSRSLGVNFSDFTIDGQLIIFSSQFLEKTSSGLRNQTEMFICSPDNGKIDSLMAARSYPEKHLFSFMTTYDFVSQVADDTYVYVPVLDPETIVRDTVYRFHGNKLLPALKLKFSNEGELDDSGVKTVWLRKI